MNFIRNEMYYTLISSTEKGCAIHTVNSISKETIDTKETGFIQPRKAENSFFNPHQNEQG
jgi:hypothetical protein